MTQWVITFFLLASVSAVLGFGLEGSFSFGGRVAALIFTMAALALLVGRKNRRGLR